ncbi:hypothetical protein J4205_00420 [Candidatus Pacearchaeota archaeon]|nr:hypothetical protein [Candidatus Pacearchaeota archaeon]
MERGNSVLDQREKIISFIKIRGPCLPVHISQHLKIDSLLASAMLAELLSDKRLKLSNLRVGNSPLYYLVGQEFQIENFYQYLPNKEKEAFEILKDKGVLKDADQLPAIRVALRSIKDFAFPFQHNNELYWRFIKINEGNASELIQNTLTTQIKPVQMEIPIVRKILPEHIERVREPLVQKTVEMITPESIFTKEEPKKASLILERKVQENVLKSTKSKKEKNKSEFVSKVYEFFENNSLKLVKEISAKKKEFTGIINVENNGKLDSYLCIAKEKKSVSDKDLMKHLQLGQKENLPVLFISNGDASKKAVEWLDYLGNVIIYRKLE